MEIANELQGYRHEVPDRQLAHAPVSSVDRAYDRAKFLPERVEMMQLLADYIDDQNPHSIGQTFEHESLKALLIPTFPSNEMLCLATAYQLSVSFG